MGNNSEKVFHSMLFRHPKVYYRINQQRRDNSLSWRSVSKAILDTLFFNNRSQVVQLESRRQMEKCPATLKIRVV